MNYFSQTDERQVVWGKRVPSVVESLHTQAVCAGIERVVVEERDFHAPTAQPRLAEPMI